MSYDKEARREQYLAKLRDPRWQKKRLEVFQRDGFTCQCCCSTEDTLHVHHMYYTRGVEPWEYPLAAFKTLCESCHKTETECRGEAEQRLLQSLRMKGFCFGDIDELANAFDFRELAHTPEVVMSAITWMLMQAQDELIEIYFEQLRKRRQLKTEVVAD